jgi:hypothetical protein
MSAIMNQGTSALNAYICPAYVLRRGAAKLVPIVCTLPTFTHKSCALLRVLPQNPHSFPNIPLILHHTAAARLPPFSLFIATHCGLLRSHSLPAHVVHSCTPPLPPGRGARCATASHARFGLTFFVGGCTLSVLSHLAHQCALLAQVDWLTRRISSASPSSAIGIGQSLLFRARMHRSHWLSCTS